MKSVKTGTLPVAPGELTDLLSFLPFPKLNSIAKRLFRLGKKTWKLKTVPTINLPIKSHQQNEKQKRWHINIVQAVVPPPPLNKSKCKNCIELQKIEELLASIVIIIKKLMDLYFQKLLKFPRKLQTINAQCNNTWQKVTRFIAELKKLSSYPTNWYHKFSSKFCICIYSKSTNT